ncbi:hypothetical protein FRB99_002275 [Tulasnella sp. 403]|nr:hypothetical protein FRB99_002275 [Tulasnella sp. 403]
MTTTHTNSFSELESSSHQALYEQCLQAYNTLMDAYDAEIRERRPRILDDDPDFTSQDWYKLKQFQAWLKATTSCGCQPDGFMSLQRSKLANDCATTSEHAVPDLSRHSTLFQNLLEDHGKRAGLESEESDEESDVDSDELTARAAQRSRRHTAAYAPKPPSHDPEYYWLHRTPGWAWAPSSDFTELPMLKLTPPTEDLSGVTGTDQTGHSWTPLQNGLQDSIARLTVPQCFVVNNRNIHPSCMACSTDSQAAFRTACKEQLRLSVDDLCTLSVNDQRTIGFHGRLWSFELGSCVCTEFRIWERSGGEAGIPPEGRDNCDSTAYDEDSTDDWEVHCPASPTSGLSQCGQMYSFSSSPSSSPIILLQSECDSPVSSPPKSPRWMDLDDDDDELPDLDDWT